MATLGSAPLSDVAIGDPLGRAARKLTFLDGTVFEAMDHAAIGALIAPSRGETLHYFEAIKMRRVGVVAVCLFAGWLLWRYGLDILAAAVLAMTPPVMIEQIDKGSMQTIDFIMAEPSRLSQADKDNVAQIYQQLAAALPVGDTGPLLEDIILEGNLLLFLSFGRHQETAADEFGLTLARDAGFDPAGLKQFFDEMARAYDGQEPAQWMSTHPSNAERTIAIKDFIDTL